MFENNNGMKCMKAQSQVFVFNHRPMNADRGMCPGVPQLSRAFDTWKENRWTVWIVV